MKEELPSITSLKMENKERWCLQFDEMKNIQK